MCLGLVRLEKGVRLGQLGLVVQQRRLLLVRQDGEESVAALPLLPVLAAARCLDVFDAVRRIAVGSRQVVVVLELGQ